VNRSAFAAAALVAVAACTRAPRPQAPAATMAPLPATPLAPFATRRVVLAPTQYLRQGDTLGWSARIASPRDFLANVDAELTFALEQRGLKGVWVFPEALARSVKRNPTYAADPYALAAQWLRPPTRKLPEQIPNPLADQLRTLVAINNARYVVLPVEVRFTAAGGAGRAVLHLVLIDARAARVGWVGDIVSEPSPSFSPALAASLASRTADLFVAR
jgi:hypothetical protein